MRVSEAMSRDVRIITPGQPVREAARLMAELDAGALPVGENDRLIGMITDRDIAIRAVAAGKGPDAPVRDVMTPQIRYVYEDEDLSEAVKIMREAKVRRLPVLNREKRLVGILSLGDVAVSEPPKATEAVRDVSKPGGPHTQTRI